MAARNAGFSQIWLPARSHAGYPYLRRAWVGMPKIPTPYLKCTFYLYRNREDALVGRDLGGTGFFVGLPSEVEPGQLYMIAVSNWHNMCKRAYPVIRVNKIGGGVDVFDLQPDEWQFVPGGHDIAAVLIKLDESVHDVTAVDLKDFLTEDRITDLEIGPGENVFMAGRFIDHDGRDTNKPALRFGHISMMPEFIRQHNRARQPTYCVDMHSRTGFSGSPVFAFRTFGEDLSRPNTLDLNREKLFIGLLGIHWGQFPEYWEISNGISNSESEAHSLVTDGQLVKGLSGMTCVAPAWGITEVINRTKILSQIKNSERDSENCIISGQIPAVPIAE